MADTVPIQEGPIASNNGAFLYLLSVAIWRQPSFSPNGHEFVNRLAILTQDRRRTQTHFRCNNTEFPFDQIFAWVKQGADPGSEFESDSHGAKSRFSALFIYPIQIQQVWGFFERIQYKCQARIKVQFYKCGVIFRNGYVFLADWIAYIREEDQKGRPFRKLTAEYVKGVVAMLLRPAIEPPPP